MASAPPDLPESIVVGDFSGIRNTVALERLSTKELAAAVNVDIDDASQVRRRRGHQQVASGDWHSLADLGDIRLVVKDGELGFLDDGLNHSPLTTVGDARLVYTRVGPTVYFTSSTTSGKIESGVVLPWGAPGAGEWLSPVIQPTSTLGPIAGRQLTAPPRATEIESYKGRIYLASGRALWATELFLYDKIDMSKNYVYLEDDITMVRSVGDGLYVGTTRQLLFLRGTFSDGLVAQTVMDSPVVRGSAVVVPWTKVHPRARSQPMPEGFGPVFMTGAGICVGLDSGEVYNLTQDHMVFPGAASAAALYREDQGANAYVAVTDSGGSPAANARIGDYVDAEIVRASQGG